MTDETALNTRHADKMRKKKAARDKIIAGKTIEKGLLIVHTGKGKGKSTAAFGMIFRCIGHGMRAGVIQFIKAMGEGFTWETQDRARDIAHARAAWEHSKAMIADPSFRMVLLDELNIVLRYDYLPLEEVLEVLKNKPSDKHVIVTGRNAREELVALADLVTEMTEIKHPFRSGVKAQAGVEF